jgi:mannosyltransferase OCH1-like enzyme
MQYQNSEINPNPKKKRTKHDIFPEKYHLELHKNTSNFKSEWTNNINVLNFNEVHLSFPQNQNTTQIHEQFTENTNTNKFAIPIYSKNRNSIENQNQNPVEIEIIENLDNIPLPPQKQKNNETINFLIENKKTKKTKTNQSNKIYDEKSAIIYSKTVSLSSSSSVIRETIIPKQVFMCWSTSILPPKMQEVIDQNKLLNPEFTFHIYDDIQCREFIKNNFEISVVYAFDKLIPGAYKADLWRLCVLFIEGGIYLDIKFKCINGFTFSDVIDREYLTLDIPSLSWTNKMHGIYNGFMVCKSKNPFLWKCICKIVDNVENEEYGKSCLFPTGPGLLGDIYFDNVEDETEFIHKLSLEFDCVFSRNIKNIILHNTAILEIYPEYRTEQKQEGKLYYSVLWNKHRIYDTNLNIKKEKALEFIKQESVIPLSVIPLKIYQTWYTKELPELLQQNITLLKEQNPEFTFYLFDDNDCREFIQKYFDDDVINAFDKLIPGAYKADLFRYCILYIYGGIYLDIKYYGINGFKFITLTEKEYLVQDLPISGNGIYNALMICKAGNKLLWKAIQNIVENVSTLFYGTSTLEPTGPLLLKNIIDNNKEKEEIALIHREIYIRDGNSYDYKTEYYIYNSNNIPILTFSNKYRELQNELFKHTNTQPYYQLWKNRNVYL